MGIGLSGHDKTGTDLNSLCTKHEDCRSTTSIRNTTCTNYRNIDRIYHLPNQGHGGQLTDMATRFHPFSDDSINTQFFHPFSQGNRWHNWDNDNTSSMEALHIFTWIPSTSRYNLDTFFDDQIYDIICKWRQEHDIDSKGFICNGLNLINVGLYDFLRGISPADDA